MKRGQADVTDAELALLQSLWDQGPATIRQLVERVYGQDGTSVYATVQKLLDRLQTKGCVLRDRSQPVHVFRAAIGRDELIGRRLRAVADVALWRLADAAVDAACRRSRAFPQRSPGPAGIDRPA